MAQSFRTEFPSRVSLEERELVDSILGYHAHNLFSIAAKSSNGDPLVIQLYPLTDHSDAYKSKQRNSFEMFPTIFWLLSSDLKKRVGELESAGWVARLEARLSSSPEYLAQMVNCNKNYAEIRMSMLTAEHLEELIQRGWESRMRESGVAGLKTSGFGTVKCLHAHYAHYLATRDNLVGLWVHDLLQNYTPDSFLDGPVGQSDAITFPPSDIN